ncbi:DUF1365 family protein [Bradyrhizobium sp. AZCC 1578]|uniref:DUF1365 family protein n=1 Tax=Bradyrhizobium sp. AZCC 1578 TaxID=3117027 RepID=UPI002FEF8097
MEGPDSAAHGPDRDSTSMHARPQPIGHRFSYRVTSLLIDLDVADSNRQSLLLCVNRAALCSFHEACGRSHRRARPSIPAWRVEKSTSILRRRCPPRAKH